MSGSDEKDKAAGFMWEDSDDTGGQPPVYEDIDEEPEQITRPVRATRSGAPQPARAAMPRDREVRQVGDRPTPRDNTLAPGGRAEPNREANSIEGIDPSRTRRFSSRNPSIGLGNLPAHRMKPGWDYEWKVHRVMSQEVDPSELAFMGSQGWEPEKARDWPEIVPPGWKHDYVETQGQVLYSRPRHLSLEAAQESVNEAREQREQRTRAAAAGRLKDNNGGGITRGGGVRVQTTTLEVEDQFGSYA